MSRRQGLVPDQTLNSWARPGSSDAGHNALARKAKHPNHTDMPEGCATEGSQATSSRAAREAGHGNLV